MESRIWPAAALVLLIVGPAAASGTLADDALLLQSFTDASGLAPMSAENDGTYIWTAAGGGPNSVLARYTQAGTLDALFTPGPDFRSLYTNDTGELFAKDAGPGDLWSITQAGTATLVYTLNDIEAQSAAGLDDLDHDIYTMSGGQVRRYSAPTGLPIGSFSLAGWGTVGTESAIPDDFQMETTRTGRILTYTQGIVSEWDVWGNRVGMCNVAIATPSGIDTTWSFSVDGDGRVYLYDESTASWNVYDVGGPGTPLCFGDGSGTPCPCSNDGTSKSGCANGTGNGGAMEGSGTASVTNDTFSLRADGVINNNGLFFQGNNTLGGGAGIVFGDGLRCCGGGVVRLQVVNPPGTRSPATVQMTETATTNGPNGTISAGATKCYQYWYRDPATSPCGALFNLTNAVTITWQP